MVKIKGKNCFLDINAHVYVCLYRMCSRRSKPIFPITDFDLLQSLANLSPDPGIFFSLVSAVNGCGDGETSSFNFSSKQAKNQAVR